MSSNVAFVTGAASGFGLCTTRRLLARSWKVAMVDYSPSGDVVAATLAKEFPTASCRFYRCDVSDSVALERTFKAAAAALGPFQFVFNNAGVTEKPDFADYKRVVDINLNAVIQGTALAIEVGSRPTHYKHIAAGWLCVEGGGRVTASCDWELGTWNRWLPRWLESDRDTQNTHKHTTTTQADNAQ